MAQEQPVRRARNFGELKQQHEAAAAIAQEAKILQPEQEALMCSICNEAVDFAQMALIHRTPCFHFVSSLLALVWKC